MSRRPANAAVAFWRHPELPGLELRTSSFRARAFREHFHTVYSIGLIDAGSTLSTLWGEPYAAARGQLVVLEPFAVHACHPVAGQVFSYRMFFVEPGWLAPAGLHNPAFPDPVLNDPTLFETLSDLFDDLLGARDPGRLTSRVRDAFTNLAATHGRLKGRRLREAQPWLDAGLEGTERDLDRWRDVESWARAMGLSRAHFSRRFKAAVGLSPHAYLTLLRVERAKRLLANGVPIADTAVDVGFADQSHFARTFRRFAGATPAQYQAVPIRD